MGSVHIKLLFIPLSGYFFLYWRLALNLSVILGYVLRHQPPILPAEEVKAAFDYEHEDVL
jgi:hypothetical protein